MIFYFIFAPSSAIEASRKGLLLWFNQLLPTLLPFCVLSYVVLGSNLFSASGRNGTHGGRIGIKEWYILFCGFLFGFPIGSKLSTDLYREKKISRRNAMILCCFANNLSPVFTTAAMTEILGIAIDYKFYLLLYGIPFLVCIMLLVLYGEKQSQTEEMKKNTASGFHVNMQIVDAGIINGFETLIKICGYILLFSILSEILRSIPFGSLRLKQILIGCTEVTNGMAELSGAVCLASTKYLLAILFLSWNGISGLFQTASILSGTDLSIKQYLTAKLCLSACIVGTATVLFFLGVLI